MRLKNDFIHGFNSIARSILRIGGTFLVLQFEKRSVKSKYSSEIQDFSGLSRMKVKIML